MTDLRIRMHRQGLGDCFLLSIDRAPHRSFHMLIDCGVILGTPDSATRLRAVLDSVIATTGGYVDVLVVTHEHYDHVAGFVLAPEKFAAPGEPAQGKLTVGEVWFAWTEDPANPLANQLRAERKSHLKSLAAIASQLPIDGAAAHAPDVTSALNFFGVAADGDGLGATARAMANAAKLAPAGRVKYHRPGAVLTPAEAPELRFYVLGPPMDRAALMKTDATAEVYHLGADELEAAVQVAVGDDGAPGSTDPFDSSWATPHSALDLAAAQAEAAPASKAAKATQQEHARFLQQHYFGPDDAAPEPDISWRRIDGAWLDSSNALALALDSATNNTSLVLAVEIVATGKIVLLAADAQVGNWLSWQGLAWQQDGKQVTAADLLGRTIFYKVGHHGSHNATLSHRGLELMPKQGLVAFIPVDHDMAVKKGWGQMPLPTLVDALKARCGADLVRIDQDLAAPPPGVSQGGTGVGYGSLYYDWTLPI